MPNKRLNKTLAQSASYEKVQRITEMPKNIASLVPVTQLRSAPTKEQENRGIAVGQERKPEKDINSLQRWQNRIRTEK